MGTDRRSITPEELLEHTAWMGALARTLVRDDQRAEDIVQQSCVAALQTPPRSVRSVHGWLRRVVRNLSYRTHREESRRRQRERQVARPERVHPTAEEIVERAELQHDIVHAVLELEEPYRSTVLLRFFEEMEPERIARELGIPLPTVWTRLQRALGRLRSQLDRRYGGRARWSTLPLPLAGPGFIAPAVPTSLTAATASAAASTAPAAITTCTSLALGGIAMAHKTILALVAIALVSLGVGVGIGRVTAPGRGSEPPGGVVPRSEYDALERQLASERDALAALKAAPRAGSKKTTAPTETHERATIAPSLPELEALLKSSARIDQVRAVQHLRALGTAEAIGILLEAFLASTDPVLAAMLEEALLSSEFDVSPAVLEAFDEATEPRRLRRLADMLTSLVEQQPELEEEVVSLFVESLDHPGENDERLKSVPGALAALGLGAIPALVDFISDPLTNPDGSQTAAWVLTQLDGEHQDLVRENVRDSFTSLIEAWNGGGDALTKETREGIRAKTQSLAWAAANRPWEEHDPLSEVLIESIARTQSPDQAQSLAWGVANLRGLSDRARQASARNLLDRLPADAEHPTRQSYVWAVQHLAAPNAAAPLDDNFYRILALAEERVRNDPADIQLQWLVRTLKAHEEKQKRRD